MAAMVAMLKSFAYSPESKSKLTWNLVRIICVTCRSKIDQIIPIGNPRWLPWWTSWKSIFPFFSWTKRPIDSNLVGSIGVTCRWKKSKNHSDSKSKMVAMEAILKIYFLLLLLNQKTNWLKLGRKHRSNLQIKKSSHSDSKSKIVAMGTILKIYFSLLFLNRKASWLEPG